MFRLKSFLSRIVIRVPNNVYKSYSKTVQPLEIAVNPAEKEQETTTENSDSNASSPPIVITNPKIPEDEASTQLLQMAAASADAKKSGGSSKKSPATTKKGKKCGQPKSKPPQDPGPPGGRYIEDKCDIYDIPKANSKKWRTISYTLVPLALGFSAFVLANKHEEEELDYIPYEHLYRRTKRFPWRDGKTSLFHGPNNLIPEEEEERLDREAEEKQTEAPPPTPAKKGDPPPPPPEKEVRYKKRINEQEEKLKRREQHAQEELERRKRRHDEEELAKASDKQ